MSRQTSLRGGKAKGVPGAAQKLGSEWLGWRGVVAHPDAPAGGGGHGHFLLRRVAQRKPATRPSAGRPRPIAPVPLQGTPAPRPPNQSPVTNPHSLGVLKSVQTDLVDVKVDAKVVADGAAASGAGETSFTQPGWTSPGYSTDPHHKIVKFNGKFTWKGTITVQTVYAAQARPDQLSGYGRGTTDADVRSRDITLGFHESCHRRDYEAYLKAHPLPEPPHMAVGMTEKEFKDGTAAFDKAFKAYFKTMEDESVAKTDEVGYHRSTWLRTGRPFQHTVP